MSGARKLAAVAGLAAVVVGGWSVLGVSPAGASQSPPAHAPAAHTPPAQAHPGQPVPRTGAPGAAHTPPAAPGGHGTAGDGHGTPASAGHGNAGDAHGATAGHGEAAHGTTAAAPVVEDELVPTYFGQTPDAETALTVLRDGNARWVTGHTQSPKTDAATRRETAENGQHPFATILTCADSRIPVERVFDRGIGELFVLRVAGNVVSETEAGTIEYGVEHLHTPVVVVMGHTGCGAVKAACAGGAAHGNVRFLIGEIEPAVRRTATMHPSLEGDELVAAAVRENVMQSMFDLLATSDSLRSAVDGGTVRLVGAVYDLGTGKVEWIGEHPWQDGLISVMNNRAANMPRDHATAEATGGRDGH